MAQVIDAERLKQLRTLRGLTQEELAQRGGVNKQTVYRHEKGAVGRPRTHDQLAQALGVDPEVLTGEKPIPSEVSQPSATEEVASYQLNVRVDAAVRNAFELAARRYGVSVTKIAALAPLLFVILAEESLRQRRNNVEECRTKYDKYLEAKSLIPYHIPVYELNDEIGEEEHSIATNDVFGRTLSDTATDNWDRDNPFATYLKELTAGRENIIDIGAVGPKSTNYRVCRLEAVVLAGDEFAESLLNGEVPIRRMMREVGSGAVTERIEWMRQNKISVVKVEEEPLFDVPEPPIDLSLAIDIEI